MTVEQNDFQKKLRVLRENFARDLPGYMDAVMDVWNRLERTRDKEALIELHRKLHSLAGSGQTFGFSETGSKARAVERMLQPALKNPDAYDRWMAAQVKSGLEELRDIVEASTAGMASLEQESGPVEVSAGPAAEKPYVYFVEDDPYLVSEIETLLGNFAYRAVRARDLDEILELFEHADKNHPDAIIAHFDRMNRSDISPKIREIKQTHGVPLVVVSEYDDLDMRLAAVRAGVDDYFITPLNTNRLIDRLDTLTDRTPSDPYRILIIEDDPHQADYYEEILRREGMITYLVNDPLNVMGPLMDFNPDLILMDLYMPRCSGIELARVIRMKGLFVSIPIVFLSLEKDVDLQLKAMSYGGDDFLTKPISPDHLVSSVKTKVKRYRDLRSLMIRDSLTGLLNHTSTKERLAGEVARAGRGKNSLAFAMIDLDHFKMVNDIYGHPTGDKVLKSLARLLRQRLRKTDIVGRYGGEEFAAILIDCRPETAFNICEEIRKDFARLKHPHEDGDFTVTFSCGIAAYPEFPDAKTINDAADRALYRAKNEGRNRVILAHPDK